MKRFAILFILLWISHRGLIAQTTGSNLDGERIAKVLLSGKITDSRNGEALPGASISLTDLRRGTVSDEKGMYRISNISSGKYTIEVSYMGYSSVVETIELESDTQKDFLLTPSFIENQTVTVLGISSATTARRSPIPINIIKKESLFENVSTNLIDNLAKTPGVSQVSTGPAISKPFIRGLGYNRVVVVNDGIKQEGQQWGDEHGIEIDEQNVNKVEVLKGPASITYGSDALAGVINIISILPAQEGLIRGNIQSGYQANNRQRNLHADVNGNHNGFIWGIYGSYKAAADYKNKYDGYVFNSKFNEKDFGGYIGLNKSWGFAHLYASNFNQRLGLVEGDRDDASGQFVKQVNDGGIAEEEVATDADFKSTDPYISRQHIEHLKIGSDNSFNIGKNRLTVVLGYQRNQRMEFSNILEPGEKELYFDMGTFNYNFQYHLAEVNHWKTTIGLNGMRQVSQNKGIEFLIPEYSLFDVGGFAFTQKTIDKVTLSGGIRLDTRHLDSRELMEGSSIRFPGFTKNFSNVSGSAGISYEASKQVTLKFNVARGFRAPGIPELASNGAHEGTFRFEYGSQDLKSETSLQTDAGIEIASEHVSFNLNIFYNPIRNFIYYRKLESVNGGDSTIVDGSQIFYAFKYNQDNAKLFGTEFNLDIHPHPLDWLHIENTFSYVRGLLSIEQDGSQNLPFIPATKLVNEIRADFAKKGKLFRNGFIKIELDNTFKQNHPFTGYNTETATSGYSLVNAALGGNIINKNKTLFSLFFGVNNLGDVAYQNHLSRLKYAPENLVTGRTGVFNMGRNFSVKLNIPISFSEK